jgi:hypothetical protein
LGWKLALVASVTVPLVYFIYGLRMSIAEKSVKRDNKLMEEAGKVMSKNQTV